jgi:hypothetical protein
VEWMSGCLASLEDNLISKSDSSRKFAVYLKNNYILPILLFLGWSCRYVTNLYFSWFGATLVNVLGC